MGFDSFFAISGNSEINPDLAVPAFIFKLRVELIYDIPCRAIKGIRKDLEYEDIQEGGLNDFVHMRRKPMSKHLTFQIERYVGMNTQWKAVDFIDPLALGTELVAPVILTVSKNIKKVMGNRVYVFTGCTVIGKDYGDMSAENSGLLVETVTIAYRELICLDKPSWIPDA